VNEGEKVLLPVLEGVEVLVIVGNAVPVCVCVNVCVAEAVLVVEGDAPADKEAVGVEGPVFVGEVVIVAEGDRVATLGVVVPVAVAGWLPDWVTVGVPVCVEVGVPVVETVLPAV